MRFALPATFLLLAAPLAAQTVIPLDEALRLARTRTTEVLRADAQVQSARVTAQSVDDRKWPSLSLGAGGGQRYGLAFDQTSGSLTQATVESVDIGLDARYTLFDGHQRRAEARSAEADLRASEFGRARSEQLSGVAVLQGYLAVAQAEAAQVVTAEDEAAQRDLLAEVEAQVEFGERPAYEIAQQEERVAAAQGSGLAAQRDQALAEARLVRVLDLDPTKDYAFPPPATPDAEPLASADALVRRALDARTDLQSAGAALQAAESRARAARASRLPQVSIGAFVGTSYSSATDIGFPGQVGDNRSGLLRLSVSVPILDRGLTRATTRQAAARVALLLAEEEDARRAVSLEVRERRIELDALAARAEISGVRVRAAETALAAERARFSAGETTLQSVSLLQARVVEARTEQERLGVEATFQRLLLEIAIGDVE